MFVCIPQNSASYRLVGYETNFRTACTLFARSILASGHSTKTHANCNANKLFTQNCNFAISLFLYLGFISFIVIGVAAVVAWGLGCGDFRFFSPIVTVIAEFPWVTHTSWCICFFWLSDEVYIPHRRWKNVTLFTKESQKYTKENLPVQYFGSSFSMNGLIFARSSLNCHIFSTLSVDNHVGYPKSHKPTALLQP